MIEDGWSCCQRKKKLILSACIEEEAAQIYFRFLTKKIINNKDIQDQFILTVRKSSKICEKNIQGQLILTEKVYLTRQSDLGLLFWKWWHIWPKKGPVYVLLIPLWGFALGHSAGCRRGFEHLTNPWKEMRNLFSSIHSEISLSNPALLFLHLTYISVYTILVQYGWYLGFCSWSFYAGAKKCPFLTPDWSDFSSVGIGKVRWRRRRRSP